MTGRRRPVALAEAAVLLVLVAGALVYAGRSGDSLEASTGEPADPPATATTPTAGPTPTTAPGPSGEPRPPDAASRATTTRPDSPSPTAGGRLISSGGIAYPALGDPWRPAADERYAFVEEMDAEVGQYVEVEQWSRGSYSAFILVGAFSGGAEVLTRAGLGLAGGTEQLADQIANSYYQAGTGVTQTVASEAITVDGHPAHRVELTVEISDPELETTSETVIVQVVQVGPSEAAVVYATLPDLRHDLRSDIDSALTALRVAT